MSPREQRSMNCFNTSLWKQVTPVEDSFNPTQLTHCDFFFFFKSMLSFVLYLHPFPGTTIVHYLLWYHTLWYPSSPPQVFVLFCFLPSQQFKCQKKHVTHWPHLGQQAMQYNQQVVCRPTELSLMRWHPHSCISGFYFWIYILQLSYSIVP